jgi:hypothetical protein
MVSGSVPLPQVDVTAAPLASGGLCDIAGRAAGHIPAGGKYAMTIEKLVGFSMAETASS